MKKAFLFALVLLLTALLASPAIAGDYVKRGTIHLPTMNYGCNGWWALGISEYTPVIIAPNNRGNRPIDFFIDFYDASGTKVGRYPQTAGEWDQLPPYSGKVLINCDVVLNHLPSILMTGVLTWRGKVDVTPYCAVQIMYTKIEGGFVGASTNIFYDDSVR